MAMSLTDYDRLKKFMNMTESGVDAEALSALRKANAVLMKYNYTWDAVFARLITTEVESAPIEHASLHTDVPKPMSDDEINAMFQRALEKVKAGSFRDTLLSIQASWTNKHFLSPRQLATVLKASRNESGSR